MFPAVVFMSIRIRLSALIPLRIRIFHRIGVQKSNKEVGKHYPKSRVFLLLFLLDDRKDPDPDLTDLDPGGPKPT